MHRLAESKLLAGFIYGDPHMQEYIYLPPASWMPPLPCSSTRQEKNAMTSICRKPSPSSKNEAFGPAVTPSSGRIRWDEG